MDGAARLRFLPALQAFLQGVRRFRTRHETDRLLALLGGIADPKLRLHRFGENLRARGAWTIAELWCRVAGGERLAQALCLGLLPYLLNQDLRAVATASSRVEVRDQATCLLSMRPRA
jgi:hypothetical protein